MIGTVDTYYLRGEVSNSDLSKLQEYFSPPQFVFDCQQAYRFGNLIDAMITEQSRVNHYMRKVDDEPFSSTEWNLAIRMRDEFLRDSFCKQIHSLCSGQAIKSLQEFWIEYLGFRFSLPVRCKYDLWSDSLNWGGDIKSTTATTQKQFEAACIHFEYTRQRAWYMDISGAEKDVLIGISKVNQKIFRIHITRDSEFYKIGKAQYQELAFKYWTLFGDLKIAA